jgi:hypothetical protein
MRLWRKRPEAARVNGALGKADPKRKLPVLNFGGQAAELW